MDFGKLTQNEKLALYGSIATIVGGIAGALGGLMWLAVLAALGMLVVIFLPQLSPNTQLPGSKGSLMLICGGVAAAAAVLALLMFIGAIGFWFEFAPIQAILFLVGVAGAVLMGWAGWQAFQAEGGNFSIGTGSRESGRAGTDETGGSAPRNGAPRTTAHEDSAAGAPRPGESAAESPTPASTDRERREPPA